MSPETPAGVSVLPNASALPVPAPPGLVIVPAADPAGTAADIAGLVGGGHCHTVGEALEELAARRAAALEAPAALARARRADASAALAAAAPVRPGLSTVPAGLTAAAVRAAAHNLVEASETLHAAREAVGSRPRYAEDLAAVARAAQADVHQTRLDRTAAMPRANAVLVQANLGAAAIVVGRVASEAFDQAFFLVAVLPLAALVYAAHTVIAPARRARAAARRRWSALRAMNVSTMAGLAALQERAGAWERRAARLRAAEAELRAARDSWTALVGNAVAIASAGRLAADLEAAAVLDGTARAAAAAWSDAVVALQEAEDMAGTGWPPLVVLIGDRSDDPVADRLAQQQLAQLAGAATVVLIVAAPAPAEVVPDAVAEEAEAEAAVDPSGDSHEGRVARPVPAPVPVPVGAGTHRTGSATGGIVDLRERVRAGLHRLRAFTSSPRDPAASGPTAASG